MRLISLRSLFLASCAGAVAGVQAATLRVPTQYTNIQAAIDVAATSDVVLVAPGTYAANIISFSGKAITVISEAGPEVTILDGQRAVAAVAFGSGETRSSVLSGFTIRNSGSGISLSGASATIVSNIFENNDQVAGYFGAAIGGLNASPVIEQNIFRRNSTDDDFLVGVVSFVATSSPRIANNIFYDNAGRAINMTVPGHGSPVILNNTIVGNRVGVRVDGRVEVSATLFFNNIVVSNTTGLEVEFGSLPTWRNNLVGGNQTNYTGVADQTGTNGNITGVPSFVCVNTRDYRLRPGSVGIDAGDNSAPQLPATDFGGRNRIIAGQSNGPAIVDVGAFEFDPAAPVNSCPGPEIFCWEESLTTNCGVSTTLKVSVKQSNGDALNVTWTVNGSIAQVDTIEAQPFPFTNLLFFTATFSSGTNLVGISVTDSSTNASCSTSVVVLDTVPPDIECPTNQVVDMTTLEGAPVLFGAGATDFCSPTVEVVCEPPSETLFPLGTSTVTCVATDQSGNSNQCSFLVTVLGPLGIKSAVLAEMINSQELASQPPRSLNRAIRRLRRATEPERWLDETHLRNRGAARVFLDEAATVRELRRLQSLPFIVFGNPIPKLMERLAQADRTLAILRIDQAVQNDAKPRLLANAARHLAKGDEARERGHFAKAILHYFQAWKLADR